MIFHLVFLDDNQAVLDALCTNLPDVLADKLADSREFRAANEAAGRPVPDGRVRFSRTRHGYQTSRPEGDPRRYHVRLHF